MQCRTLSRQCLPMFLLKSNPCKAVAVVVAKSGRSGKNQAGTDPDHQRWGCSHERFTWLAVAGPPSSSFRSFAKESNSWQKVVNVFSGPRQATLKGRNFLGGIVNSWLNWRMYFGFLVLELCSLFLEHSGIQLSFHDLRSILELKCLIYMAFAGFCSIPTRFRETFYSHGNCK